jgi:oligoendopeptidase F
MKNKSIIVALTFLFSLFFMNSNKLVAQQERNEIDSKYKWDLTHLFASENEWKKAKEEFTNQLSKVESFKGTLTQSSDQLLACLSFNSEVAKEASLLYTYASMNSDLDTRDMKNSGMVKEMQQIFSDYSAKSAFVNPEILSVKWEVIEGFIKEEPKLKEYEKGLYDLFRMQKHTLSEKEEKIMALSGLVNTAPGSVYRTFSNAEMPNPKVTLSNGEEVTLNSAGYSKNRSNVNREDRKLVFESYWNNYKDFEATFGEMMYGGVKTHIFNARARNYNSALEAALFQHNIPVDVYHSLIENVNKNLPAFHRYLGIKKRMLGVDTLKYLDLYAPTVKDVDLSYSYDDGMELILKSFKPMGDEYLSTVKKAFENNWIDVYPNKGKRSGAYSNGSAYDYHPYILLNYNDKYDDVSTLAHELGHTMHSYFSNKEQPYPTSRYAIFVAEVASTFNEELLFYEVLETIKDDETKLSLLMERLDAFKGTLFRQTQFAEYELRIHEAAEKGQPLTGEFLSKLYTEIVHKYYGHNEGVCFIDKYIEMEWAFIPHFYYNFYVYQYSTSFTASVSLAEKVINKEEGALEKYMKFLSSGGSDYPIELLKQAGVDMTSSEPFDKTIKAMDKIMDEIESILDKQNK